MRKLTQFQAKAVSVALATMVAALLVWPLVLRGEADSLLATTFLGMGVFGFGMTFYTLLERNKLIEASKFRSR